MKLPPWALLVNLACIAAAVVLLIVSFRINQDTAANLAVAQHNLDQARRNLEMRP